VYLVKNFDKNGDNQISKEEASLVKVINCSNLNISDVSGIEAFNNIEELYLDNNYISAINISLFQSLRIVDLSNTMIRGKIDCSNNTLLKYIYMLNCSVDEIIVNDNCTYDNIAISYDYNNVKVLNTTGATVAKFFIGQYIPYMNNNISMGTIVYKVQNGGNNCSVISAIETYGEHGAEYEIKNKYGSCSVPYASELTDYVAKYIYTINSVLAHYNEDIIIGTYMTSSSGSASNRYQTVTFSYNANADTYSYSIYEYADKYSSYKYRVQINL
jgi:hypothetical protein